MGLALGLSTSCVSVPRQDPLQFEVDTDTLLSAFEKPLDKAAAALRDDPDLHLMVVGHADEDNTDEYNRALSERRAAHVRSRILQRLADLPAGANAGERIHTEARGEWDLSVSGEDPEAKARNRRAELRFFYPRQCEPSFDAEFLSCEWNRLPPPRPIEIAIPEPAPEPTTPESAPERPPPKLRSDFRGPYVYGLLGYAIGSSEYLRQHLRHGVGAGYLWGAKSEFRVSVGATFDHLVDLGFLFPQSGPCAPFCERVDRSRIRIVPELRVGGTSRSIWGWLRLSAGLLLQHRESRLEATVDPLSGATTITTLAPSSWTPTAVFGIGPGVAVAITKHLLLLFDATVTYSTNDGFSGGTGIYDVGVGLGWQF